MLREILSRYAAGTAPRDWRFVRSEAGRPSLAPPYEASGLHFNVAHSAGMVAIAIGRMPRLGIDVEHESRAISLAIARRYFSAREVAALQSLPAEQQPRRLLRLWTLKEAYLKATGTGVAGGLGHMTFGFDAAGRVTFECEGDPNAGHWAFQEFNPRGFVMALACLGSGAGFSPAVTLREFRVSGQEQGAQP
jgi:4'-phosphopantetheinyl transferase